MRYTNRAIVLGWALCAVGLACSRFDAAPSSPTTTDDAGAGATGLDAAIDAAPTYRDIVLSDRPVAYWRLGEAPGEITAHDETGNGNDGTYVDGILLGKPGAIADDINTAVDLSGNGIVRIGDKLNFTGKTAMSIELWVRLDDTPRDQVFVAKGVVTQPIGYKLFLSEGNLRFDHTGEITDQGSCPCIENDGGARFGDRAFHHLVATFDTATLRVYADGVVVQTSPCSSSLPDNDASLNFGIFGYNGGVLDEVAIYDHALAEPAVKRHFDAGTRR